MGGWVDGWMDDMNSTCSCHKSVCVNGIGRKLHMWVESLLVNTILVLVSGIKCVHQFNIL